ncbi:Crp/Fnr family transcriptional regulator [Methylorubrum extorquens]|uniref:Crp/Fnr family transcriptional regulator n=1 Tax=Methylorubrum extorquens TaxID=408 RepID=UPI00288ACB91|nr:Crp/Fnr family transcriptional regulator [Methylorubrum extorquens]
MRHLGPGQDLVADGERPVHCALLVEGWSCRYKLLAEGRRQILSFHVAGDMPDLQGLHLGTLDHAVAALTPSTFALIPHESLRRLTATFPDVAALLWRETLIDAGIYRAWITAAGRRSAYGRIAHLFCEMYLRQEAVGLAANHRYLMPLRYADLADATGLTTVHISRVLKALRDANLIAVERRQMEIRDWTRLCDAGEFDPTYLRLKNFKG